MEALLFISGLLAAVGVGAVGIRYAQASANPSGPLRGIISAGSPAAPGTPAPGTQIISPTPIIVQGPDHILGAPTTDEAPANADGYHPAPAIDDPDGYHVAPTIGANPNVVTVAPSTTKIGSSVKSIIARKKAA